MKERWSFAQLALVIGCAARTAGACDLGVEQDGADTYLRLNDGPPFHTTTAAVSGVQCIEISPSLLVAWWNEQLPGESGNPYYGISLDGVSFSRITKTSYVLELKNARFDPILGQPPVDPLVEADGNVRLHFVQFHSQPLVEYREAIEALGASIRAFVPNHAFVVEMSDAARTQVEGLPFVRWVDRVHPAYKLEPYLFQNLSQRGALFPSQRYYIQVWNDAPTFKAAVAARIAQAGGTIDSLPLGSVLLQATLTPEQLFDVIRWDDILYVERWSEPIVGMDNARTVGGANAIESVAGYTGQGVRGAVADSALVPHPEFTPTPILFTNNETGAPHGTNVYGCLFSDGSGDAMARGMLPHATGIFGEWTEFGGERERHTCRLVKTDCDAECEAYGGDDPGHPCPFHALFLNTSWTGGGITPEYGTQAQAIDRSVHLFDLLMCQAQGNAGDPGDPSNISSFQEAWAKNVVSVGGIRHKDTSCRGDDEWNDGVIGVSSHGPAIDGRIKPDFVHFNDKVWTTDADAFGGPYGYFNFSGTSAASPIVAGHFGIVFQMWSDGLFGNSPPNPPDMVFENRPHAATAKAMLINTARQYEFVGDVNRGNSGWGWPDLRKLYDLRDRFPVIIDESVVLDNFETFQTTVAVEPGVPALRVTMVYTDPAATLLSDTARVHDLSLRANSPLGVVYCGNFGLDVDVWSRAGDEPDKFNTVENIFVQNPPPGVWVIEVTAAEVNPCAVCNYDTHPETPEVDVDFALVVSVEPPDCPVVDSCGAVFVDGSASGAGDGSSWGNAFTDLQQALQGAAAASACGFQPSTILVAEGTYVPSDSGDRTVSFEIQDNTQLFGGFPEGGASFAARDPIAHPTILSGDLNGDDGFANYGDNSFHVVTPFDSEIYLDGFVITSGNADGDDSAGGGGILAVSADVTLANCVVSANRSSSRGGGLAVSGAGQVYLTNCVIVGNLSDSAGGGLYRAAGAGSTTITNTSFLGNAANGAGGGAACFGLESSSLHATNCTFCGNEGTTTGGGLHVQNGQASMRNSIFWGNTVNTPGAPASQLYAAIGTLDVA